VRPWAFAGLRSARRSCHLEAAVPPSPLLRSPPSRGRSLGGRKLKALVGGKGEWSPVTLQRFAPLHVVASALHEGGTSKVASEGARSARSPPPSGSDPAEWSTAAHQQHCSRTGLSAGPVSGARRLAHPGRARAGPGAGVGQAGEPGEGIPAGRAEGRRSQTQQQRQLCSQSANAWDSRLTRKFRPALDSLLQRHAHRAVDHA